MINEDKAKFMICLYLAKENKDPEYYTLVFLSKIKRILKKIGEIIK